MLKRPGPLPCPQIAAFRAPRAKMARSSATWPSVMCSFSPAKMILCSPTTEPPRRLANPILPRARAGDAVASAFGVLFKADAAALRRRLTEQQCRAGGRVDLVAMMHLDDFDIPAIVERLRRLPDKRRQQIDAEAHIAGLDDGGVAGRACNLLFVFGCEAGRADHMNDPRLRGKRGEFDAGGGNRKVHQRIRILDDGERIRRGREAEFLAKPAQTPQIGAEIGRAFGLKPARERKAAGFGNQTDQRGAHAATRARHCDLDVLALVSRCMASEIGAPGIAATL